MFKVTDENLVIKARKFLYSDMQILAIDKVKVTGTKSIIPFKMLEERIALCPVRQDCQIGTYEVIINQLGKVYSGLLGNMVYQDILLFYNVGVLEIEYTISLGSGSNHSKWCPICCFTYNDGMVYIESVGQFTSEELFRIAF